MAKMSRFIYIENYRIFRTAENWREKINFRLKDGVYQDKDIGMSYTNYLR